MNILVAGSSGFIGQALCSSLRSKGHKIKTLVRRAAKNSTEITWDPDNFEIPGNVFEGIDIIINLCGRNISDQVWWSPKFKQELFESRVKPARTLAKAVNKFPNQKLTLITVSGIGIYGSNVNNVDEDSAIGKGFFSSLAESWEKEALSLESDLHRTIVLRLGVVLGKDGGLVKKIAPVFKLGLGAKIGNGNNWISWISLEDVCRAFEFVIDNNQLLGAINLVNPNTYRTKDFYNEIGKAFDRPVFFQIPEFLLSNILGEFARETLLASQEVKPKRLLESGFTFKINTPQEAVIVGT